MTLWFWHGFREDSLICFRQTFWDLWNETWHFVALTVSWMWQSFPDAAAPLAQGPSGNNTTSQCTTVTLFLGCNAQGNQCSDIRFRSLCIMISRTNIIWRRYSYVIWDSLPTVPHSTNGEQVWRDYRAEKPNIFWGSHPRRIRFSHYWTWTQLGNFTRNKKIFYSCAVYSNWKNRSIPLRFMDIK